jgi:hypothetical protein
MTDIQEDIELEFIKVIQYKISNLLESELDGKFSVIIHPPGYPYFVVYGNSSFYNTETLNLVDQTVVINNNGVATLANNSFSTLYLDILRNVEFNLSDEDKHLLEEKQNQYSQQSQKIINTYESNVEKITEAKITQSACYPPTKLGYIQSVFNIKYGGNPQAIPSELANLRSEYEIFLYTATTLEQFTKQISEAQIQLKTAIKNVTYPSATNGGLQISSSDYAIAYTGFPTVNQILDNLNNSENVLSISWVIKSPSSTQPTLSFDNGNSFQTAPDVMSIAFDSQDSKKLQDWSGSASKIGVEIRYPGLTIISAKPKALSTNLQTGWYSNIILSDLIEKTGTNRTGFQLVGNRYQVDSLFGIGKRLSFVKTFVISREPSVKLTFYEANLPDVGSKFKKDKLLQIKFPNALNSGCNQQFKINNITSEVNGGTIIITLSPPEEAIGTIPSQDQISHIIGGVISYPPDMVSNSTTSTIGIKFGESFYLRNKNGDYIIAAIESWGLNGLQYYPRLGNTGRVALKFKGGIDTIENGMIVQIKSTEEFVGKYNTLGAWTAPNCYYFSTENSYQQHNWQIIKKNTNNIQIRYGDAVYLKNLFYKDQKLVSDGLYLTTKKDVDEWWIIE